MSDIQRDREERQHVIEVLKSWDGYFIGYTSDEVKEALRYAIASIKTDLKYDLLYEETSGQADKPTTKNDLGVDNLGVDAISRQAINGYIDYILSHGMGKKKSFDFIKKFVANLPPATPQASTTKNDLGVDKARSDSELIARGDVLNTIKETAQYHTGDSFNADRLIRYIKELPSVTPQEPRWIPVSERVAEFPCLACDIFEQIFIPIGIVVLNSRCYEGKDFAFNVEKFLKGKEVTLFGGEKVYESPREIVAWMPLPAPYEPQESEDKE